MNKRNLILPAMLFTVLSCGSKEAAQPVNPDYEGEVVEMTISAQASKTTMGSDGSVTWNPGDRISIFDSAGNHEFVTEDGGAIAKFKGEALSNPKSVYMLYPYDPNATVDLASGEISTFIPAAQKGERNSFGKAMNVTAAIVKDRSFYALNSCGLIRLEITRNDVISVDIVSRDSKMVLAGRAKLSINGEKSVSVTADQGSPSVSLNAGGKSFEPGVYYLDAIPCQLTSGYDLRVYLADGKVSVIRKEETLKVGCSMISNVGKVDQTLNILSDRISLYFYDEVKGSLNQPFETDLPTSAKTGETAYKFNHCGQLLDFAVYSASGYRLIQSEVQNGLALTKEATEAYIKLPAISGKALKSVSLTSGTTVQAFMRYRIINDLTPASKSNPIAYLDLYGSRSPSPTGMAVNGEKDKAYYLYITSNANATLHSIDLVYDNGSSESTERGPYLVKSRSQYRKETSWTMSNETWTVDDLPGFCKVGNPDTDRYGGWKGMFTFNATGWWHCEKRNGRWWMVDPEGNPFISAGLCDFKLFTRNQPFKDAYAQKYESNVQKWANGEWNKLSSYGFNSFGAFCDESKIKNYLRVPYVLTLTPMTDYLDDIKEGYIAKYGEDCWKSEGPFGFPMVFDEGFSQKCESVFAAAQQNGYAMDKYLMGVMTDNEFPVMVNFLSTCLNWPDKEHINYKKAVQWLSDNNVSQSTALASVDWRRKFAAYCYEAYLQKVSSAMKKYLSNQLYMGTKETGSNWETALLNNYTFNVAAPYVDVFSIDYYNNWAPRPDVLRGWSERCGKPLILAEWYVKGEDVSLADPDVYTNMDGVGWTVPTQKDRGRYYQNYVLKCIESGVVVGWHWFKYCDGHPAAKISGSGYYSSDNCNKGVESITMDPYTDCLDQMKALNNQIFPLCLYYDR